MGRGPITSSRVDADLREYVTAIAAALDERGPLDRAELWDIVDGGTWDAGRFGHALSEAAVKRVIARADGNKFALADIEFASQSGSVPFVRGVEETSVQVR